MGPRDWNEEERGPTGDRVAHRSKQKYVAGCWSPEGWKAVGGRWLQLRGPRQAFRLAHRQDLLGPQDRRDT